MDKGFTMDQALAEASRCLLCHDAPCTTGCPSGTEPDRFIRKFRLGNIKGAIEVIKTNNPLGGVCAVVCPTCSLCAQGCVAAGLDRPLKIGQIQRFLVEYGWQTGFNPLKAGKPNGHKVAIVGSGPSGLACANELATRGFKPVIFEKRAKPGGMLRYAIPEHRLSPEFLDREIAEIQSLGVEIVLNRDIKTRKDLDELLDSGFEAIYIATGVWKGMTLDTPNRNLSGIYDALTFLEMAREDKAQLSNLVKGKSVGVVGGGDTAMDSAVTAVLAGARDVYLIYRRSFAEIPCSHEERERALEHGVHFLILTRPVDYLGPNGNLAGIKVCRTSLGPVDFSGRRSPQDIPGTEHVLPLDVVVEAIGLVPDDSLRKLSGLDFDRNHRIVVRDKLGRTSLAKVYAGGDAVRGASLVARGVGDGKLAAAAIAEDLVGTR